MKAHPKGDLSYKTRMMKEYNPVIKEVTMEEARALPNMLGRIAPEMLKVDGCYSAMVDGVPTLFVLEDK